MKNNFKYLLFVLGFILFSCNEKPKSFSDGNVEATVYFYDSLQQDTIIIKANLYKYTQEREIDGALLPVTTLTNNQMSISYYVGKMSYTNPTNKIFVSYQDSNGDYISVGESEANTNVLIGKNSYTCLSVFYKYE